MARLIVPVPKAVAIMLACIGTCLTSAHAQEIKNEPPFAWDALYASPNTSLVLEEALRPPRTATHQAVFYYVKAAGFSPDEPLSLWVKRGLRYFTFPATVTSEGAVLIRKGRDNLGAIVVLAYHRDEGFSVVDSSRLQTKALLMAGFKEGHPLDLALASEKSGKRAQAKVVPIPLRANGNGECSASAELQSETGLIILVSLKGFLPEEVVQIQSQYRNEIASSTKTASQTGELAIPVLFGSGDRGPASLIATTNLCTVRLDYLIGDDAIVR